MRRYLVSAMAAVVVVLASSCGDTSVKGVGWGGGVQIFAKAGTIDVSGVSRVRVCVEETCADLAGQAIGARSGTPKPFEFLFAPQDVFDRDGVPLAGRPLRVQVTLWTAANTVVATGSASSQLWYVSPTGWFCDDDLAHDEGPVVAVEFQSATRLDGVDVRVPKPSCP